MYVANKISLSQRIFYSSEKWEAKIRCDSKFFAASANSFFLFRVHCPDACRPFLSTLARHMNFTPELAVPTDGKAYGNPEKFPNFEGLLGDVYYNLTDFSLAFSPADIQVQQLRQEIKAKMIFIQEAEKSRFTLFSNLK